MDTLRNYTFLPWTRQGIGAEISVADELGTGAATGSERASVAVSFKVNGEPVAKDVQVLGPGDVVGIHASAIVKTEPRNWVTDFESNYLPYIEFYEEDFPWRFTPAKAANDLAQSRLRPWLVLVLLKEAEFVEQKPSGALAGPLPVLTIKDDADPAAFFPPPEQSWAWAHVHVSQNIIGNALQTTTAQEVAAVEQALSQQLRSNPDVASSRLLSARKLEKNCAYHAFVLPAFETGRLAGLGQPVPTDMSGQLASWGAGQKLYPIYHRWFFATGASGDFEFLVDLLEPRRVDPRVGIRAVDLQNPGYEVEGMTGALRTMGLEGALKSLNTVSAPAEWPPADTDFGDPAPGSAGRFLNQLEQKVNLQFDLKQEESADNPHPDPIVSPPLYGRWYAMAERLNVQAGSGWVDELNRDPRQRIPAGTGTLVVQQKQETLMQQAWAQLGDLPQTNQKIRQMQLALMSSFVAYQEHVLPQATDQLLSFTHAVQPRVLGSPTTIAQQVEASRLPRAALDPAFRKLARPRGAIMRKVTRAGTPRPRAVLARLNDGTLSAAPPAPEPTGQISLDGLTQGIPSDKPPAWLAALLHSGLLTLGLVALAIAGLAAAARAGSLLLAVVVIAVVIALARAIQRLRQALAAPEPPREAAFEPALVDAVPARPSFALTEYDAPLPVGDGGAAAGADSVEASRFRVALKDAFNVYQSPPPAAPVKAPLDLDNAVAKLKQALNPALTLPRRFEFVLKIPPSIRDAYLRPRKTFVPVMAHPVFAEPMYRALRDISSEFIAPNLGLIPNNTIALMETNQRFIEAYMVGLNDEMGRELLWRQFPTDQRGSYFRQFWDVGDAINRDPSQPSAQLEEALLDITKLHTWERDTALGSHPNRPLPTGSEEDGARLVLVVRGDLLKKYPTAVIYAQRARWGKDEQGRDIRELDDGDPAVCIQVPIFKAEIEPDVRFLGFDLKADAVKGSADPAAADPGWYFVIQERPGEPRFGLDDFSGETPQPASTWNELSWSHLADGASPGCVDLDAPVLVSNPMQLPDDQFAWGRNAADMAYILYQVPVMVAFHAADMLD